MRLKYNKRAWDLFVSGLVLCSLSTSLVGCTMEAQGDAENIASVSNALVPAGPYNIGQIGPGNAAPVWLEDTSNNWDNPGACFLMSIGGKLDGQLDWAEVMKQSNGLFRLAGGSGRPDRFPIAKAGCVPDPIGYRASWERGQSKIPLRRGGTCFLTRVQGEFVGGGEWVGVWQEGTQWFLGGGSGINGSMNASAGCVSAPQLLRVEHDGADWDVRLTRKSSTACFLQLVSGQLRSVAQVLDISTSSSTSFWHLAGRSGGAYVHGAAGCIDAPGTILTP